MRFFAKYVKYLPNKCFPYRFAGGWIYLNIKGGGTFMERAFGLYEVSKNKAIRDMLKTGMTFVDVGVHKGDYSFIAARTVGPKGRVIAFEPLPENCYWIRRGQKLNRYKMLEFHQALGKTDEQTNLYLGKGTGWNSLCLD